MYTWYPGTRGGTGVRVAVFCTSIVSTIVCCVDQQLYDVLLVILVLCRYYDLRVPPPFDLAPNLPTPTRSRCDPQSLRVKSVNC